MALPACIWGNARFFLGRGRAAGAVRQSFQADSGSLSIGIFISPPVLDPWTLVIGQRGFQRTLGETSASAIDRICWQSAIQPAVGNEKEPS